MLSQCFRPIWHKNRLCNRGKSVFGCYLTIRFRPSTKLVLLVSFRGNREQEEVDCGSDVPCYNLCETRVSEPCDFFSTCYRFVNTEITWTQKAGNDSSRLVCFFNALICARTNWPWQCTKQRFWKCSQFLSEPFVSSRKQFLSPK